MRLFSREDATGVDDAGQSYTPAPDGGFDFPEELADRLHGTCAAGRPLWETSVERQQRLVDEELKRRADPATLLAAVETLVKAAQATAPAEPAPEPASAKTAAKTAPVKAGK